MGHVAKARFLHETNEIADQVSQEYASILLIRSLFELRFLLALRPTTLSFPAMANFLYPALPIATFKSGHFGVVCLTFFLSDALFHPAPLLLLPVLRRSFPPTCSSSPAWLVVLGPDKSLFLLHPVEKKKVLVIVGAHEQICLCKWRQEGQRDVEAKGLGS